MSAIIIKIKTPRDCHECDAVGISDIVGLHCPDYAFDKRPHSCPLKTTEGLIKELKNIQNRMSPADDRREVYLSANDVMDIMKKYSGGKNDD